MLATLAGHHSGGGTWELGSSKKKLLRGCGHIFRVPEALAPTF